jgi:hypothetical protein
MSDRAVKVARAIQAFVDNPAAIRVKGVVLLIIGLADASHTLIDHITRKHLRVGHGLIIIGLFGILEALPHFLGGLEAGERFLDPRSRTSPPGGGPGAAQGRDED